MKIKYTTDQRGRDKKEVNLVFALKKKKKNREQGPQLPPQEVLLLWTMAQLFSPAQRSHVVSNLGATHCLFLFLSLKHNLLEILPDLQGENKRLAVK